MLSQQDWVEVRGAGRTRAPTTCPTTTIFGGHVLPGPPPHTPMTLSELMVIHLQQAF